MADCKKELRDSKNKKIDLDNVRLPETEKRCLQAKGDGLKSVLEENMFAVSHK